MAIKNIIIDIIANALNIDRDTIKLEKPKRSSHGDITTNIALKIAKKLDKSPMEICSSIKDDLDDIEMVDRVDIITPGFINIFLKKVSKVESVIAMLENINLPAYEETINIYTNDVDKSNLQRMRLEEYIGVYTHCFEKLGFRIVNENTERGSSILSPGDTIIEDGGIRKSIDPDMLIKRLGHNRVRLHMILNPINDNMVVELLDDRLLYLLYPLRRIEIVRERMIEEGLELSGITKEINNVDNQTLNLLLGLGEYKDTFEKTAKTKDVQILVDYLLRLIKDFYSINNNTRIRLLNKDELNELITIYGYFEKIIRLIFDYLSIDTEEVYS